MGVIKTHLSEEYQNHTCFCFVVLTNDCILSYFRVRMPRGIKSNDHQAF